MNRTLIIALAVGVLIALVIGISLAMMSGNNSYPERPGVGTNPDALRVTPEIPAPTNAAPAAPANGS